MGSGLNILLKPIKISRKAILSFTLPLLALSLAVVAGGYVWRGYFGVQLTTWVCVGGLGVAYIFYRGTFRRAELPRTGIEWVFVFGVTALMGSWILSPDPRQGLGRVGWLLGCLILFYLLVDALETSAERQAVLRAVLWVSGLLTALVLLETDASYQQWWQVSGWGTLPPYPYRFVSLLGHSNAFMGMANLCAPLALVALLRARTFAGRLGATGWLLLYLLALPFSSSARRLVGFCCLGGAFLSAMGLGGQTVAEAVPAFWPAAAVGNTHRSGCSGSSGMGGVPFLGFVCRPSFARFQPLWWAPRHLDERHQGLASLTAVWGRARSLWLRILLRRTQHAAGLLGAARP